MGMSNASIYVVGRCPVSESDLRAFVYIHKFHLSREELKKYNVKITSNHSEDPAIGTTYWGCPKMDYPSNSCASCENFIANHKKKMKYHSSNGFEIDIMEAYNEFKTLKKPSSSKLTPVVGDLKKHGWAVYEGINIRDLKEHGKLFEDCRDLVNTSNPHAKWSSAQLKRPAQTNRMKCSLTRPQIFHQGKTEKGLETILSLYKKIEDEKLKMIEGFEKSIIASMALLRNEKAVNEQIPHRDYEKSSHH